MVAIDEKLIERVAETIIERFHPRRIVLFGSQARGDAESESDFDLFVEMETSDPRKSAAAIGRAFGPHAWPMDIIVWTPEDVAQWTGNIGTIVYAVERQGRVLYDGRESIPMTPANPPYPPYRAWLEKAASDVLVVQMCLAAPRIPWDAVCFHAQQAAKKVLKGFLVNHGQQLQKTHKLEDVLAECVTFAPTLKKLHAACVRLTPYGVDPRYLDLSPAHARVKGDRRFERWSAFALRCSP